MVLYHFKVRGLWCGNKAIGSKLISLRGVNWSYVLTKFEKVGHKMDSEQSVIGVHVNVSVIISHIVCGFISGSRKISWIS